MPRTIHKTKNPVVLDGFQAIMKPSQYGYTLSAVVDQEMINTLEEERVGALEWAKSKLKNPRRSTLKAEPWEEVAAGKYRVKFTWKAEARPPIVDTEGTQLSDERTPIYSGSQMKLAFYQKPYTMPDGTYGTTLKLIAGQLVALQSDAGVDVGDMTTEEVSDLFGKTKGFKVSEPNVSVEEAPGVPCSVEEGDEFEF